MTSYTTFIIYVPKFQLASEQAPCFVLGGSREIFSSTIDKEGGFVNRPPIMDSTNYDYWKACMVDFLKSMDNKIWKEVIKG